MDDKQFEEYRDSRYKEALGYYDGKAVCNQRLYHLFSVLVIIISVVVPILLAIDSYVKDNLWPKITATVLSPIVAIFTAIIAHFHFRENWINFRSTWDALNHELHWRNSKTNEYRSVEDQNALFVERVEMIIANEGQDWLQMHKNDGTRKDRQENK